MKKSVVVTIVLLLAFALFRYGSEAYMNRGSDYPEGPTVNGEELFVDGSTNTFYTSFEMAEEDLFSGTSIRYHINGGMLAKAGLLEGKLHGPFDSWYENGQKQISLIWYKGERFRRFKAFHSNGDEIKGDANEIAGKIFSGQMVLE